MRTLLIIGASFPLLAAVPDPAEIIRQAESSCQCFRKIHEKPRKDASKPLQACVSTNESVISKWVDPDRIEFTEEGQLYMETYSACMLKMGDIGKDALDMCSCIIATAKAGSEPIRNACPEAVSLYMGKYSSSPVEEELFAQTLGGCILKSPEVRKAIYKEKVAAERTVPIDTTKSLQLELSKTIEDYGRKNGRLPESLRDVVKSIPKDGWGNELRFRPLPGCPGGFEILSLGPDGVEGGGDDIGTFINCGN
jgi:hypothetical protein